jgi:uncharacterized protein
MPTRIHKPGKFDLKVKRSSAGLGLFAASEIPRNACIIEYVGRELTKEEAENSKSKYLFEISSRRTIDGTERKNIARYINHACKPNAEAEIHRGRVFIFALRKIQPGEELTYNYGKEYFNDIIKPMGCRCSSCKAKKS